MRISTRMQKTLLVGLLTVVCVLFSAANAFAAEKVDKVAKISYAFIGSGADATAMLNIQLPEKTKLPADVEFNLPISTQIQWAGEILGGDTSKDPQVEVKKVSGDKEVNRYRATLTKSRILQVEGEDGPASKNAENNVVVMNVGYMPATGADELVLGAEIPKTATIQAQDGMGDLGEGKAGHVYGFALKDVKAGQGQSVEIAYKSNAPAKQAGSQGNNTVIIVLVVVLVLAIMALIIVMAAKKSREASSGGKSGTSSKKVMKGSSPADAQQSPSLNKKNATELVFDVEDEKAPRKKASQPAKKAEHVATSDTEEPRKLSAKTLALIITVAIIVIGVLAIVIAGNLSSKVSEVNGVYYKEFAQGDPCQKVNFALTDAALSDPKKAASEIFDVLGSADFQILKASLDPAQKSLTVEFCESKTTSKKIEELLANNAYIGQSDAVDIGQAIVESDGSTSMYYTEISPCVYDAFVVENPTGDVADLVQKLYDAAKAVPSLARMNYNGETHAVTFGFCDEQTADADIEAALKSAGFKVKLTQKAQAPTASTNQ